MRNTLIALALALAALTGACSGSDDVLTVYSGRSENLIQPLLDDYTATTGVDVDVRFGDSADLALLIAEEGDRSPADVFISQSPGAIGFLAERGRLQAIDDAVLDLVPAEFHNADGLWVGLSGRVRVLVYNTDLVDAAELPDSVFDLTAAEFRSRVGLAPTNGSFQDFVTAMREINGDDTTLAWLEAMAANDAQTYANNTAIVQAVGRGEVPYGLVNHYYNLRALAEDAGAASANHFFPDGDIGALLIATAAGIVDTADDSGLAREFIEFLLSKPAQRFFADETFEYPLAAGVPPSGDLPPLSSLDVATYDFDRLGGGLERTTELIDASGLTGS